MFSTKTKTHKLLTALQSGQALTESQIEKRFNIGNARAEIHRVRRAGFAVYTNKRKAANHMIVTEYRMGKPSRKIIAAGYKAIQLGLA